MGLEFTEGNEAIARDPTVCRLDTGDTDWAAIVIANTGTGDDIVRTY